MTAVPLYVIEREARLDVRHETLVIDIPENTQ
jgi:hypothetical protein